MDTEEKVAQYIERHRLFAAGSKVLVALSGGADSVALLCLLSGLGYPCEAAHCNFGLRGEESDRDEAFVRGLCREHAIPLHVTRFETTKEAEKRHISIEMAARELRYRWFEEVRQQCGAEAIAVAHHRDDSIETFLLNLLRGTGINGLRGIQPRRGNIMRPLLCLDRQEIIGYLESIGQAYVTDSSNLEDEYMRNKIRLHLLPLMEEIHPAARRSIQQTAAHLDEAAEIHNRSMEELCRKVRTPEGISIPLLQQTPAPQSVLHELLHPLGFNSAQIAEMARTLNGQPGKVFTAAGGRVVKDRDMLLVEAASISDTAQSAGKPVLEMEEAAYTPEFAIPRDRCTACFDADKLEHPLSLRLWRHGDTFVPFGMKGRKRVSDYLTDRKFSLPRKERQWVLCCGEEIIWLVGERTDNRFRIDEKTKRVLLIRYIQ